VGIAPSIGMSRRNRAPRANRSVLDNEMIRIWVYELAVLLALISPLIISRALGFDLTGELTVLIYVIISIPTTAIVQIYYIANL